MIFEKTYLKILDIIPTPTYRKEVLHTSQLETIQDSILHPLSEVDVHSPSQKALTIFTDTCICRNFLDRT
jgi:hypothetical protein